MMSNSNILFFLSISIIDYLKAQFIIAKNVFRYKEEEAYNNYFLIFLFIFSFTIIILYILFFY